MAWNKPVTNYEPATQTDQGPYNTTRAKGEDGRYTANESYKGSEIEKKQEFERLKSKHPFYSEKIKERSEVGFNTEALSFDDRVSIPFFEKILPDTIYAKMVNSPKITKTTKYEDQNLKIDMFLGESNPEYAFMISDPNVKKIDLKTMKGALNDKAFYDYPLIDFTIMKIHSRMPDILNNQVSKGRNSDYLFQIPYSTRQGNYTNPEDISAAKFYLVPKDTMKNIIKGHNQDFATTCAKALLRDPYDYEPSSSDIQSTLQNIAEEHGYDYDFDNYTNPRYNRHIIQTDTETLYFEQDKKTRDWSVRVEFDAMDFDDNDEVVYDEWRKTN